MPLLMFATCRKKKSKGREINQRRSAAKITDTDARDESNSCSC